MLFDYVGAGSSIKSDLVLCLKRLCCHLIVSLLNIVEKTHMLFCDYKIMKKNTKNITFPFHKLNNTINNLKSDLDISCTATIHLRLAPFENTVIFIL